MSSDEMPSDFEEFDVMAEGEAEAESPLSLDDLGGLAESDSQLTELLEARDEVERQLLVDPESYAAAVAADGPAGFGNYVGVGIGEEEVGGIPTGRLAIKVMVKEKLGVSAVAAAALAPETVQGHPVDVDASGEVWANAFTARRRPAPGGVSIGNCTRVMAGTLGCLVRRGNELFILSNNHVMALVNTSPINTPIPQPGRLDGGVCPQDTIARLTQFIPINFAAGACNFVDAAIARTSPALVDRRIIRPVGPPQALVAPVAPAGLNQLVQKSGRTTQYRRGIIDAINVTVNVSYAPLGGVARFCRQFRVRGINAIFSDRGDSGSLVTTFPANRPTGLLFAGNAASNMTFCNPIQPVLTAFGVTIVF